MKYMGSKARHAKEILAIVLKDRYASQWYVEPFVGGANVIENVKEPCLGFDTDKDLIGLLKAASGGWMPPADITEDDYKLLKKDFPKGNPLRGYAAFALSYGGKKWGGWRRDSTGNRDYADEARRSALVQFPKLRGIVFECKSYEDLDLPEKSLIYCDPPYAGTTSYGTRWDDKKFWDVAEKWVNDGHAVFVSEYTAPDGWICVWEKPVKSSLTKNTGAKIAIEKLFTKEKTK